MPKIETITRVTYRVGGVEYSTRKEAAAQLGLHECPKCHGAGAVTITYNAYPSGFPDSGWAEDMKTKQIPCDVCEGEGYTAQKFVPVTKITGYKPVS